VARANGALAQKVLTEAAGVTDYDQAKRHWELVAISTDSEDPSFMPNCELCHTPHLEANFIIEHSVTHTQLRVGSKCILQFVYLADTANADDSRALFTKRAKQLNAEQPLKMLALEMMSDPVSAEKLQEFRRRAAEFFGLQVRHMMEAQWQSTDWQRFLKVVNPLGKPKLTEAVRAALFSPKDLHARYSKSVDRKEPEPWRKRYRTVLTTLSRSGAYRNPSDVVK
jgi:hypothetical protein